jgi:uncharacterized UBP type Zn finger protein
VCIWALAARQATAGGPIDPSEVKRCLARTARNFEGGAQQDAHEFLTYLLDRLHVEASALGQAKRTSEEKDQEQLDQRNPIQACFRCDVEHTRSCNGCQVGSLQQDRGHPLCCVTWPRLGVLQSARMLWWSNTVSWHWSWAA